MMTTDITALLAEAETYSADTRDFEAWSDAKVLEFNITPRSTLDCFEVVRFDYPSSPGQELPQQA